MTKRPRKQSPPATVGVVGADALLEDVRQIKDYINEQDPLRFVPGVAQLLAESPTVTGLDVLVPNTANPRKPWSDEQVAAFRASLQKFGDLGGIVRNVTTNQLIGGHKRVEAFRSASSVDVVSTPQPIDAQGTVAHGYVVVDGNRFAYREVQWSDQDEVAANLAANRWGAEWDWHLVADALKSITDDELRTMTGFAPHEIANLTAAVWTVPPKGDLDGDHPDHAVHLTAEQYELLVDVKRRMDTTVSDDVVIEHLCRRFLESVTDGATEGGTS